jgi:cyclopropane-fatty-acyl-phospholipid synthase
MAARYPNARILSVSNSRSQRGFILRRAADQGLANIDVVTADMNAFTTERRFDRVVSVEMFEHMANWQILLERIATWLKPHGRLYIHIFSHRDAPYRFEQADKSDWIAQHFFTGGVMPSHDLPGQFPDLFQVEADWRWSGAHYARTAHDWLANYDRNGAAIRPILAQTYGDDAILWGRRWRLFFLATAGLFGHRGGSEWGVSHYLMAPAR